MQVFLLILSGFLSGIFAGMGMGGGTILVPMLTLFACLPQRLSQAINLIVFLPVAVVTIIIYSKQKLIDFSLWWKISLPASIVAAISAIISFKISSNLLKILFATFLIVLATHQLLAMLFKPIIYKICNKNVQKDKNF